MKIKQKSKFEKANPILLQLRPKEAIFLSKLIFKKEGHVIFTIVLFKPLSDQQCEKWYLTWKVLTFKAHSWSDIAFNSTIGNPTCHSMNKESDMPLYDKEFDMPLYE